MGALLRDIRPDGGPDGSGASFEHPAMVGILGGMGPAAGVDFARLFVQACEQCLRDARRPVRDQAFPAHWLGQLPIVDRTFDVCREALGIARLTANDFDQVLLVGGSTRIPMVRSRVEEFFKKPLRANINPDEVVASGPDSAFSPLGALLASSAAPRN